MSSSDSESDIQMSDAPKSSSTPTPMNRAQRKLLSKTKLNYNEMSMSNLKNALRNTQRFLKKKVNKERKKEKNKNTCIKIN
jgi:hypothetical protein